MDYARFNYVAQPGDMERGVRMMPPRFGLYDDYLIRWNYTPVPEAKTEEEALILCINPRQCPTSCETT